MVRSRRFRGSAVARGIRLVVALGAALALLVPTPSRGEPLTRDGIDWSTYGFDLARTGFNPFETTIGVDNAGSLHELWSYHLGGQAVNQASYATGVLVTGKPRIGVSEGVLVAHPSAGTTDTFEL